MILECKPFINFKICLYKLKFKPPAFNNKKFQKYKKIVEKEEIISISLLYPVLFIIVCIQKQ